MKQQFTGKEWDADGAVDYFGARYHAAAQGRFTSPDPLVFHREMLTDPQQFNLYAYTRNNPLRFIDPTGGRIRLIGDEQERKEQLEAAQSAVGWLAGGLLEIVQDESGEYFIDIKAGGEAAFRYYNEATPFFAEALSRDTETINLALAASAQQLAIVDERNLPYTLAEGRARGATGRDPGRQLWIYLLRPQERLASEDPTKFQGADGRVLLSYWATLGEIGLSTDRGRVLGHELGHALYRARLGPGNPSVNRAGSDVSALTLENAVLKARGSSLIRIRH